MPKHIRRIYADSDVYWLRSDHLGSASLTPDKQVILTGLADL